MDDLRWSSRRRLQALFTFAIQLQTRGDGGLTNGDLAISGVLQRWSSGGNDVFCNAGRKMVCARGSGYWGMDRR